MLCRHMDPDKNKEVRHLAVGIDSEYILQFPSRSLEIVPIILGESEGRRLPARSSLW